MLNAKIGLEKRLYLQRIYLMNYTFEHLNVLKSEHQEGNIVIGNLE